MVLPISGARAQVKSGASPVSSHSRRSASGGALASRLIHVLRASLIVRHPCVVV
jgi:hypothetical protein